MNRPTLETRQLWKAYRNGKAQSWVLSGIDLQIMQGEILAIMGPSGCGKTTLLNLLGGLDRPTCGDIIVCDKPLGSMTDAELTRLRLAEVGFVFQAYNLISTLTAIENVELPLSLLRMTKAQRLARASWLLELVGLVGKEDRLPSELSGGEQQRVAVARAVANNPRVILADEPTGNLDSSNSAQIMKTLTDLNEELGQTLVVVTHDSKVAASATRIIRMVDGRVVEDCSSDSEDIATDVPVGPERVTRGRVGVVIRMLDGSTVGAHSQSISEQASATREQDSETSLTRELGDTQLVTREWALYLSWLRVWLQLRNRSIDEKLRGR
jgi:putative ABC transport system ATP-binding protein